MARVLLNQLSAAQQLAVTGLGLAVGFLIDTNTPVTGTTQVMEITGRKHYINAAGKVHHKP